MKDPNKDKVTRPKFNHRECVRLLSLYRQSASAVRNVYEITTTSEYKLCTVKINKNTQCFELMFVHIDKKTLPPRELFPGVVKDMGVLKALFDPNSVKGFITSYDELVIFIEVRHYVDTYNALAFGYEFNKTSPPDYVMEHLSNLKIKELLTERLHTYAAPNGEIWEVYIESTDEGNRIRLMGSTLISTLPIRDTLDPDNIPPINIVEVLDVSVLEYIDVFESFNHNGVVRKSCSQPTEGIREYMFDLIEVAHKSGEDDKETKPDVDVNSIIVRRAAI